MRRVVPLALAIVLLTAIVPAAAKSEPGSQVGVSTTLVDSARLLVRGSPVEAVVLGGTPALGVGLAFVQPAVRGVDDTLAILHVAPLGVASWSGVWWAESSAGVSTPHKVTVPVEGMWLVVEGGAFATAGTLAVSYAFVGADGNGWRHDTPRVQVFDVLPRGGVVVSAAAAGQGVVADILLVAPWNLRANAVHAGVTLRDADGRVLDDVHAGACAGDEAALTERGCRPILLLVNTGATVTPWSEDARGRRVYGEDVDVGGLVDAPHFFARGRSPAPTLAVRAEGSL